MQFSTRREFQRSGFASILSICFLDSSYSFAPPQRQGSNKPFDQWRFFSKSGDDDFDRAMIAELKRICQILEVNPGFKYIDQENAFAIMETTVQGTAGTVLLGLSFVKKLMSEDNGGVGVAAVCAHECGHIYQFKNDLLDKLSNNDGRVLYRELHADVAVRPLKIDRDVAAFDVAGFTQAFSKCPYIVGVRLGRAGVKKSDHRHRRLLCPRRQRPRRRVPPSSVMNSRRCIQIM